MPPGHALASETATPYDRHFYDAVGEGSLRSARAIIPRVMDLLGPRSVVDFGCGIGTWLKAFIEAGVEDYLGLDGDYVARDQLLIDPSRFRPSDLTMLKSLERSFDLAVCLEVGEHLPARASRQLVAALASTAPCVLFSAALPGQGGTHHINERWPSYWQRLFSYHGFDRLDPIRPRVWRDRSVEWWYKQNIYLFCRRSFIEAHVNLREEVALAAECPFELVHSNILAPFTTVSGLMRNLFAAIPRSMRRILRLSSSA